MAKYEIIYIMNSESSNLEKLQEKLHKILTMNGGKIDSIDSSEIKDLSYKIKHKTKGHYVVLKTTNDNSEIEEFKRIALIEKDLTRFKIFNLEKDKNYSDQKLVFKERDNDSKPRRFSRDDRSVRRTNYQGDRTSNFNREKK